MQHHTFNPGPLGLSGFALTTWLLSMINAGFFSIQNEPMVLACAFAFGGMAQFIAGLMEGKEGNSFGFVAFCGYGAFWLSFSLFIQYFSNGVEPFFVGWYLALWGLFTFYLWVATWKKNKTLMLLFGFLFITFIFLSAKDFLAMPIMGVIGGYFGLLTATIAFYLAAAEIINESWGRRVLPI